MCFLTLAHSGSGQRLLSASVAELPAHDAGRLQVPAVVTHCSPLAVLQHLHPTLAEPRASLQPHVALDTDICVTIVTCPERSGSWSPLNNDFTEVFSFFFRPLFCMKSGPGMQLTTAAAPPSQDVPLALPNSRGQAARCTSVPVHATEWMWK